MPEESAMTGLTPTITPCIYWKLSLKKIGLKALVHSRQLDLHRSDQGYGQKGASACKTWKYKARLSVPAQERLQKKTDRIIQAEVAASTRIARCLVNPFKKFTINHVSKKFNEISSRYKFLS